jgi:hypothetical protein
LCCDVEILLYVAGGVTSDRVNATKNNNNSDDDDDDEDSEELDQESSLLAESAAKVQMLSMNF